MKLNATTSLTRYAQRVSPVAPYTVPHFRDLRFSQGLEICVFLRREFLADS